MLPVDTMLGELRIAEIYIEYDGPQLFVAENQAGRLFLAVHAPWSDEGDNWLYAEISRRRLAELEGNGVELRQAFEAPETDTLYTVTFKPGGGSRVGRLAPMHIPAAWFPKAGLLLNDDQDELPPLSETARAGDPANEEYLWAVLRPAFSYPGVNAEPIDPSFSRPQLPTPLWRDTVEGRAMVQALRVPVAEAAQACGRVVCDLILEPGAGRNDVPVSSLGSLLSATQRLMDAFGQIGGEVPPTRQSKAALRDRTKLHAIGAFPGSFGLRVEAGNAGLLPDERLVQAFDRLMRMVTAGSDRQAVRAGLDAIGRRAAGYYRVFARTLAEASVDFTMTVGVPDDPTPRGASIGKEGLQLLSSMLSEEARSEPETIYFEGRLVAANLRSRFFMMEDGNVLIGGKVAKEAVESLRQKQLDARHRAKIEEVREFNEGSGEEVSSYTLIHIDAA
jgi:hypothetical protein